MPSKTGSYDGSFSAKGGASGGDGGKVETSGHKVDIASSVAVNTLAPKGKAGNWTIDPDDLTITDGAGLPVRLIRMRPLSPMERSSTSSTTTGVTLAANNSITVDAAIDSSAQSSSTTLALNDQNADSNLTVNLNAAITLGSNQTLTGEASLVNVASTGLIQNGLDVAASGATVDLGAGTFDVSSTLKLNKDGLTLTSDAGAVLDVADSTDAIWIQANDVTVSNLELTGPAAGVSYLTYGWGSNVTRGVVVKRGYTNFAITNNNIHGLRNNILIDGIDNTGSITGNTIDNSKSGISIQYTDGTGITISGNSEGPFGNEWGVNLHLNGYWDGATIHSNPYPGGAAPLAVQQALLANSNANGGWTVQDQAYTSSNRTAVTVDENGNDSKQGSALNPLATVAAGVSAVVTGGTVNVNAGTYALAGQLSISKSLSLIGAGDGSTILNSSSTGYGISVSADDVTLSSFTFNASGVNASSTYGIKVSPGGAASSRLLNFGIDHVTINGSYHTGLDFNGVKGATIDHVNVNDTVWGNGISLTNSADVTVTNTTTSGNAWGGLAIYQANRSYDQKVDNITIDGTNTFNEANGLYAQDQSATNDIGTLNFSGLGIQYVAKITTPSASGDGDYTFFQTTQQGAIDLADAFNARYGVTDATVQGYAGTSVDGNNTFYVGVATGGDNLSIQAAVDTATSGATINVASGTYDEALDISKSVDIEGAGAGSTIIQPTSLLSTGVGHKYASNVKTSVFVHDTTGVTINNLTIDGNELGNDAIVFWNNASGTISNALIENAMSSLTGAQTGQGIAVDVTDGNTSDLTLDGVTIPELQQERDRRGNGRCHQPRQRHDQSDGHRFDVHRRRQHRHDCPERHRAVGAAWRDGQCEHRRLNLLRLQLYGRRHRRGRAAIWLAERHGVGQQFVLHERAGLPVDRWRRRARTRRHDRQHIRWCGSKHGDARSAVLDPGAHSRRVD